jgi:hypothetical protein
MKLAVLERIFSPPLSVPMTYDHWMVTNHALDGCLEARQVHWLCSLVSTRGDRCMWLFTAPYTEALREACRQARMPFQQVWTAELGASNVPYSFPQYTTLIVVDSHYPVPNPLAESEATQSQTQEDLEPLSVQPAFSVFALDGTRSVGLFDGSDAEAVRSLYGKLEQPFQAIWQGTLIHPVGECSSG